MGAHTHTHTRSVGRFHRGGTFLMALLGGRANGKSKIVIMYGIAHGIAQVSEK